VLLAPLAATSYDAGEVQAGVDDPNGAPLTFDATAPTGIGQPFAYTARNDLFADCAGWDDTAGAVPPGGPAYTTGSIEYLQQLFSGLGHAMNGAIPVVAPSRMPKFSVPRSTAPTIYAELDWAGRYPVIDQERVQQVGGVADFPPSIDPNSKGEPGPLSALNSYLALTFYLFYPAMEPSPVAAPDPDVNRFREGQWEAVTLFVKGNPDFGTTDPQGRPDFPFKLVTGTGSKAGTFELQGLTPRFLAYSTGYSLGDDNFNPLSATIQPWPDGASQTTAAVFNGWNPMVFVTAGTHRNLYSIDATVTPGTSQPNPFLNTTGGVLMGAAGGAFTFCAGVLLATPPPANAGAFVACLWIAGAIFVIGLIMFLLSFWLTDTTPDTETPQSSQPGTDVARDDGPAAIPATPGSGVPTHASSVAQPTLRLISEFGFDPTPPITTFPLPSPLPATGAIEMPSWWTFPGRWGVRVTPMASGSWDSGSRRTDPFGRTRAYWNAYQLVQFVAARGGAISL
jgi:hypothetical protein